MITVIVNGNDIGFDGADAGTIGDVVGSVAQDLDTSLRIVKIAYNGEDITGQPERHLDPIREGVFELETAQAKVLASETLESISEFHGALVREFAKAAGEFRDGSFERANEYFLRCIDGLQVLSKTTQSVANLLQLPLHEIKAGDGSLTDLTERISEALNEMIEAQQNQDAVLIADLIEYELQVMLEDWEGVLNELIAEGQAA